MLAGLGIITNFFIAGIQEAEIQEIKTKLFDFEQTVNSAHKGIQKVQEERSQALTQVHQILTHISDMEEYNKEFKYNINHKVDILKTLTCIMRYNCTTTKTIIKRNRNITVKGLG